MESDKKTDLYCEVMDGSPDAMFRLGEAFYYEEQGFEWNEEVGRKWMHHAANLGHLQAMTTVGSMLLHRASPQEGFSLLQKAANLGHPDALNELGHFHFYDAKMHCYNLLGGNKTEGLMFFIKFAEADPCRGKPILQRAVDVFCRE